MECRPGRQEKENAMYKHILVPTDGSKLSAKAIRAATRLAKICSARITGIYVVSSYVPPVYAEGTIYGGLSPRNYREIQHKEAKKALALVEIEAQTSGLRASTVSVTADQPWKA